MGNRLVPVVATLGCICVGVTGCGVTPASTLDRSSVQHHISIWLASHYGVDGPAVTCPSGVLARAGTKFDCSTVVAGQTITVSGTVADGAGHFDVALDHAIINSAYAGKALTESLGKLGGAHLTVNCGSHKVEVVAPGGTFECTATTPTGQTVTLTATATSTAADSSGQLTFSVGTSPRPPAGPSNPAPAATAPVTDSPTTVVTDPPATDPPVVDTTTTAPPVTDPPVTDPPATDPTTTAPPATDPPTTVATDPSTTTGTDNGGMGGGGDTTTIDPDPGTPPPAGTQADTAQADTTTAGTTPSDTTTTSTPPGS